MAEKFRFLPPTEHSLPGGNHQRYHSARRQARLLNKLVAMNQHQGTSAAELRECLSEAGETARDIATRSKLESAVLQHFWRCFGAHRYQHLRQYESISSSFVYTARRLNPSVVSVYQTKTAREKGGSGDSLTEYAEGSSTAPKFSNSAYLALRTDKPSDPPPTALTSVAHC